MASSVAEYRGDVDEPAQDPGSGHDVERLEQPGVGLAKAARRALEEQAVYRRAVPPQLREPIGGDHQGLNNLEGSCGSGMASIGQQQTELTDDLAGQRDIDDCGLTPVRRHPHADPSVEDEVKAVGPVTFVEQGLAGPVPPVNASGQQLPGLGLRGTEE